MKFLVFLSILIMSFNVVADDIIGGENVEVFTFLAQHKSELASCVEEKTGFYPVLKIKPVDSIQDGETYYYVSYDVSDVKKKMNFTYKAIIQKELMEDQEDRLKESLCSSLAKEIDEQLEKDHKRKQTQALFIEEDMNVKSYGLEAKSQMDNEGNNKYNVWFLIPGTNIKTLPEEISIFKTKIGLETSKINGVEKKYLSLITSPFLLAAAENAQTPLGSLDIGRTEAKIYLSDKGTPSGQISVTFLNLNEGVVLYTQKNLDVLFNFSAGMGLVHQFNENQNNQGAFVNAHIGIGTLLFERLQLRIGFKGTFTTSGVDRFETTFKQTDNSVRYDLYINDALYALASLRLDGGWSVYGEYQGSIVTAGNAYKNGKSTSDANVKRSTLNIGVKFTP